ncbi:uncharacterized protein LOC120294106 [Eucalyptus grandis]|uniref:uncharacterized protein LOC120294106 n=1 Tax=Eucalyptus grandis TaxID=71139 RepID=UPI00192EBB75|nr:uncharacterized protein LOC120294106 [Eucalyptus grandis]
MKLFVKTLPYEFRNRMASTYVENFNQLIPVGEQIEMRLRDGWFNEPTHQGKRFTMKKDKEPATEVNVAYAQPAPSKPPMVRIPGNQQDGGRVLHSGNSPKGSSLLFPGPLSRVLPILRKKGLISHEPKRPNAEKFSNYDPSKKCEYHMGEKNPLPEHQGNVNAIFEFNAGKKMNLKVSIKDIYRGLVELVTIRRDENPPLPTMKERVQEMVKAGMIVSSRTYAQANAQPAKPVTDEEAKEFLAIIKASSKRSSCTETIEVNRLEEFVGSILLKDLIAFSDEEFPLEGRGHTKALYISVKCKASHVARVLIDNGSALNICPLATLHRLKIDPSKINAAKTSIRAFDVTRKEVIGETHLELQIGPVMFNVLFQVMDIPTAFNFLLGRPWIHTAGAVPSSLHQSVKFVVEGKLVIVHGEEDHRIYHETAIPYIEPERREESSYQSFELVSTIHASRGSTAPTPDVSNAAVMVARVMVGNRFIPGRGLGRREQGIRNPIEAPRRRSDPTRDIVPDGWKSMDDPTASKTEDPDNGMEGITTLFDDLLIGAIDEEASEETGASPQESSLMAGKEVKMVQSNAMCDDDDDPDDPNGDSIEVQQSWEHHEKPKVLTSEQTVTINLSDDEDPKEIKIGANLPKDEAEHLTQLLKEYQDIFAWTYADMPGLDPSIVEHCLPTNPDMRPKKQKLRRTKPELSKKIEEEVMKLLKVGFIEVSQYPEWVANIVPVMKKDGRVRVCVDYRDLNKASPKDDFPLPHIDVLVDSTAGFELFSFMDGFFGYNQIRMKDEDKEKTAFITPWGTFHYKVMPFGLKNAGATYQRAMVTLFHDMMHEEIEVYVDDMIAKTRPGKSHVETLKKLFDRLREFKLRLNPAKCVFGAASGKLLGFMVSSKGIEIDPSKAKAICELQPPSTVKEVRSLLGRLNYIARFISQLSETAKPFFKLLRKNVRVEWNDECQEAFNKLKQYLTNPPVLVPPISGHPLILYLTIHSESLGAICDKYTLHYQTFLVTENNPIKYLFNQPALVGKLAKWQVLISEFDVQFMPQKSVKGRVIADILAENPRNLNDDDCPLDDRILAISEDAWSMFFDGAVNLSGSGTGAVLISPDGQHFPVAAKLIFPCTNNIAEYEACILGLQAAIEMGLAKLKVYGDSAPIILRIVGKWKTRDAKLLPYHKYLEELVKEFDEISFDYLARSHNQFADALATLSSMLQVTDGLEVEPLKIEVLAKPSYCMAVNKELDEKPWYCDIMNYIQKQEFPEGSTTADRKYIMKMASKFFVSGKNLYKRSYDSVLLRCVDEAEATQIMQEVHEGVCGPHMNGHMLAKKIMRLGYYWLALESDCIQHVRSCHRCQIHGDKINVPPTELHQLSSHGLSQCGGLM